jgi:SAM-dependent methyltransferase
VNGEHLALCSSAEWADAVQRWIIPWVLDSVDLGDDVLEVGPGPGLTTDALRSRVARLTAVEKDTRLAAALAERLADTNVEVVCADATDTGLPADRFSGVVCLTMLHHVPTVEAQDALFAEILRVLRSGGVLAGEDNLDGPELRVLHHDDTCVPVDPAGLAARLERAGYTRVAVDTNEYAVRFRAAKASRPA